MQTLLINPKNKHLLDGISEFREIGTRGLYDLSVVYSNAVPERDIEERWVPPEPERFVSYGPEDECWARPLGLGSIEYIDRGPLFLISHFVGYV